MTAILLREIFADGKASAQASIETRSVNENAVRLADHYIHLANQSLRSPAQAAPVTTQPKPATVSPKTG